MSLKMELVFTALILTCFHSFVLPDSQGDALYALKNSLNATGNQPEDWNALQGNGITGVIPEEYGNLSSLQILNLERNNLRGVIPSSLGNLKQLQFLSLSQNNLTGTIPESLSSLQVLINFQLDSNNFSGQIHEQLFQVSMY
ncbi:hypothetical protein UlMin_005401, partial [Ulmus minor]